MASSQYGNSSMWVVPRAGGKLLSLSWVLVAFSGVSARTRVCARTRFCTCLYLCVFVCVCVRVDERTSPLPKHARTHAPPRRHLPA